jgi:hypothetical protein
MTCAAAAIQNDAIWLELRNYGVVPLNAALVSRIPELSMALRQGVAACPDQSRDGFYSVELNRGSAYIHIHDGSHTVYLVAYSRS